MKIANKTNFHTEKTQNPHNLPIFGSKKIVKNIEDITKSEGTKLASTIAASIGTASIAINANSSNSDENEFRKKLAEKRNVFDSGLVQTTYSEADINLIVNTRKINPTLTDKVVDMTIVLCLGTFPRFSAIEIKNLVTAEKDNPVLLNKLVDSATVDKDGKKEYTYSSEEILKIMELAKDNPKLIERLVDEKIELPNGIIKPKHTSRFQFKSILNAYAQNPVVTEDLLNYNNLSAKEIEDIAKNLSPKFYQELNETLSEDVPDKILYIKKYSEIADALTCDIKDLGMSQKEALYTLFDRILQDSVVEIYRKHIPNFDNKINQLKMAIGMYKDNISTPIKIQNLFVANVLANNNPDTEEVLKNFDFAQYQKEGIPLKYSRDDFVAKINSLTKNLSTEEQDTVLQNFGLIRGYDDFDGLLTNKSFKNTSVSQKAQNAAKEIQKEIELFTHKNEVLTGDKKADKVLTGLVQGFPEFAFFVGKKQHDTHNYSVDIHTLKVLQSIMNNPHYLELSDKGKTILKMAVIMHDFGKKGGIRDAGHASLSSAYASAILQKFSFSDELNNRIIDIIENHHWFEEYNQGSTKAHDVAALCRNPEDFLMYKMFAKADFENVNDYFHFQCSDVNNQKEYEAFMENKMKPIQKELEKMRSKSNFVFDTKFMHNGEKFPRKTIIIDGEPVELKVLNFNELKDNENLQKYGFAPYVTKENAYFLVHMTLLSEFEDTLKLTQNLANRVAWSTSLIKNSSKNTVGRYGFIFNTEQANISLGYFENLSLGHRRNLQNFYNILFLEENAKFQIIPEVYKEKRVFLRDKLLESLKQKGIELTLDEYAKLAEYITSKKFLSQFNQDIVIGNKTIKSSVIKESLEEIKSSLFVGSGHNEVECVMPTVKGLYANVSRIEDCPQEFLKFAAAHNLPVVLM